MKTVDQVDLERFMGDWYVIANIPTFIEKEAFNAIESYRLDEDGSVETTFRFNKGGFDGPEKVYTSRAFVIDTASNAHWGMQFVWPFKAAYLILYLDPDYRKTIVGVPDRDHIWIMSREPEMSDAEYQQMLEYAAELGYELDSLGTNRFSGTLPNGFSAHPKYDPATGELHAMAYHWPDLVDHIQYVVVGADVAIMHIAGKTSGALGDPG